MTHLTSLQALHASVHMPLFILWRRIVLFSGHLAAGRGRNKQRQKRKRKRKKKAEAGFIRVQMLLARSSAVPPMTAGAILTQHPRNLQTEVTLLPEAMMPNNDKLICCRMHVYQQHNDNRKCPPEILCGMSVCCMTAGPTMPCRRWLMLTSARRQATLPLAIIALHSRVQLHRCSQHVLHSVSGMHMPRWEALVF